MKGVVLGGSRVEDRRRHQRTNWRVQGAERVLRETSAGGVCILWMPMLYPKEQATKNSAGDAK